MQAMDVVKLLLITVLTAVVGGCIIGIVYGKHAVKKASSDHRPLLSNKERLIYLALLVVGAACVAAGVFLVPSLNKGEDLIGDPDMMGEEGYYEGEEGYFDGDAVAVDGQLADADDQAQDGDDDELMDDGSEDAEVADGDETAVADAEGLVEPDAATTADSAQANANSGGTVVYDSGDGEAVVVFG